MTGEIDAILVVVAREVAELQRVILRLSARGGAGRVTTLLRLEQLKPASPLPLGGAPAARGNGAPQRSVPAANHLKLTSDSSASVRLGPVVTVTRAPSWFPGAASSSSWPRLFSR